MVSSTGVSTTRGGCQQQGRGVIRRLTDPPGEGVGYFPEEKTSQSLWKIKPVSHYPPPGEGNPGSHVKCPSENFSGAFGARPAPTPPGGRGLRPKTKPRYEGSTTICPFAKVVYTNQSLAVDWQLHCYCFAQPVGFSKHSSVGQGILDKVPQNQFLFISNLHPFPFESSIHKQKIESVSYVGPGWENAR